MWKNDLHAGLSPGRPGYVSVSCQTFHYFLLCYYLITFFFFFFLHLTVVDLFFIFKKNIFIFSQD